MALARASPCLPFLLRQHFVVRTLPNIIHKTTLLLVTPRNNRIDLSHPHALPARRDATNRQADGGRGQGGRGGEPNGHGRRAQGKTRARRQYGRRGAEARVARADPQGRAHAGELRCGGGAPRKPRAAQRMRPRAARPRQGIHARSMRAPSQASRTSTRCTWSAARRRAAPGEGAPPWAFGGARFRRGAAGRPSRACAGACTPAFVRWGRGTAQRQGCAAAAPLRPRGDGPAPRPTPDPLRQPAQARIFRGRDLAGSLWSRRSLRQRRGRGGEPSARPAWRGA
jgi:hypothetical protein